MKFSDYIKEDDEAKETTGHEASETPAQETAEHVDDEAKETIGKFNIELTKEELSVHKNIATILHILNEIDHGDMATTRSILQGLERALENASSNLEDLLADIEKTEDAK